MVQACNISTCHNTTCQTFLISFLFRSLSLLLSGPQMFLRERRLIYGLVSARVSYYVSNFTTKTFQMAENLRNIRHFSWSVEDFVIIKLKLYISLLLIYNFFIVTFILLIMYVSK